MVIHLLSFYFIIIQDRIIYDEWPLYSSIVPPNTTPYITTIVINYSLAFYILISPIAITTLLIRRQYKKVVF